MGGEGIGEGLRREVRGGSGGIWLPATMTAADAQNAIGRGGGRREEEEEEGVLWS